jgi:formylglycine-generating enzyme required for sulfatase activity
MSEAMAHPGAGGKQGRDPDGRRNMHPERAGRAQVCGLRLALPAIGLLLILVCLGCHKDAGTQPVQPGKLPPEMVGIPSGSFLMGSPVSEYGRVSEETEHTVRFSYDLFVSKYEVKQSEWVAVMGWDDSYFPGAERPVEDVTWFDAVKFCVDLSTLQGKSPVYTITDPTQIGTHLTGGTVVMDSTANGYRLLTEAEWEYACRATSTTAFCNGAMDSTGARCAPLNQVLDYVGWYCGNAGGQSHDVGGKTANAWGLADLDGNVGEWCWDWWGPYLAINLPNPTGAATGAARIVRGGSWDVGPQYCRSAARHHLDPTARGGRVGFRIAMLPSGACCFHDGHCTFVTPTACHADQGIWLGLDRPCDPLPCAPPTGACCFENGLCLELAQSACSDEHGTWQGMDTSCTPNPCPQPTGGCCFTSGDCAIKTEAECPLPNLFHPGWTSCLPDSCPLAGACCAPDGACTISIEIGCLLPSHWHPEQPSCSPDPCALPVRNRR